MCGILCNITKNHNLDDFKNMLKQLDFRGPDNNKILQITSNIIFGFTRLAINDVSENGDQPMILDDTYYLICNGEIYNYKKLVEENEFKLKSSSDCEVILHMYKKYGMLKTIKKLDGVFGFVLYDKSMNHIYIARDRFGVRPLFIGNDKKGNTLIASTIKAISDYSINIQPIMPGTFSKLELFDSNSNITYINEIQKYNMNLYLFVNNDFKMICTKIKELLINAVQKRLMSDRPIGCLLSGGLDSSLVSALVNLNFKKGHLNTFAIGMKGSEDLKYAQIAADYLGTTHHNIEVAEFDFLNAIEEVIYHIESYDVTTVRASIGNYLVSKYIRENTDCKVIYNGDGSEEIFGSYLWLSQIKSEKDFYDENLKLLTEIHYFDVLRSDRSISSCGLEPRVPFLDKDLVKYVMSITPRFKMFGEDGKIEKHILRSAFDSMKLLPDEILWRKKEAFSDGVSSKENSWHVILREYIDTKVTDEEYETYNIYKHNKPLTKEGYYYRKIFEKYYKGKANIIPHFWMPSKKYFPHIRDPSARILKMYNK
tara:strand:- start:9041 stop:10657 length:1617 start_codon:yes stop_codon:yes gene_type:complete